MKVLIWIGCIFLQGLVIGICKNQGIILGGLPTALLTFGTLSLAFYLCRKWDNKHKNGKNGTEEQEGKKDE